ncbi:MAG: hypothetical protein AB7V50_04905 [Vampirovibrionia bacterium]
MGFFKSLASNISKGLLSSAKERLTDTLKNQVAPYIADEAIIHSKSFLFDQMDVLLASVKGVLIELKIKARSTNMLQDDRAFATFMELLKEFSASVIATIEEIETY